MLILGLTGSIACGKTWIANVLRELGARVVDGDELSRRLTCPGGPALPAIRQGFGDGVFRADGTLDRAALGRIVFGDPVALERLNAIMQPALRQMIAEEIGLARDAGAACCVLDMPLLFEEGLDRLCSRVWCAWVPEQVQIARMAERDGFDRETALRRIAAQIPADEKAARSDLVLNTDRPAEETASMVREAYAQELRRAAEEAGERGGGCP